MDFLDILCRATAILNLFKDGIKDDSIGPFPKDSIFYSPGVLPALGFILRGFTKKGEGVIIQEPVFYPFAELIEGTDRKIVNNQLINNDENYSIDFIDLENKLKDPNNTMLILCSPHNPVGRGMDKG